MFFGGGGFPGGFPGGGGAGMGQRGPVNNKRYYELLEVDQGASDAEIKKAHRRQALQHHPDKGAPADAIGAVSARRAPPLGGSTRAMGPINTEGRGAAPMGAPDRSCGASRSPPLTRRRSPLPALPQAATRRSSRR